MFEKEEDQEEDREDDHAEKREHNDQTNKEWRHTNIKFIVLLFLYVCHIIII